MEHSQLKTAPEINDWLEKMNITNYVIKEDLTVNVSGNVYIFGKSLTHIPIQFGIVRGDFDCSNNNLTSLKGSPHEVGAELDCSYNMLTNLEYGPTIVNGNLYCNNNKLTSLEGAPKEVGKTFNCNSNLLTTLKYGPKEVGKDYFCTHNPSLQNLKGIPKEINGVLSLNKCNIISLKDLPEIIEDSLLLTHNKNLVIHYEDIKNKFIREKIVIPYSLFSQYESCANKLDIQKDIMQLEYRKFIKFLEIENEKNTLLDLISDKKSNTKLKI